VGAWPRGSYIYKKLSARHCLAKGRMRNFRKRLLLLASLRSLRTVLGTTLHTALNTLGIERTADNVVTHARQVLDTAAADQHDRVLLKVVSDAGNVSGDFIAVRQADTSNLSQSGVRLLGGRGSDCGADTSLLGRRQIGGAILEGVDTLLQCRRRGLVGSLFSALSDKLIKSGHGFPPFLNGRC